MTHPRIEGKFYPLQQGDRRAARFSFGIYLTSEVLEGGDK
jgi:hypothetical protein